MQMLSQQACKAFLGHSKGQQRVLLLVRHASEALLRLPGR